MPVGAETDTMKPVKASLAPIAAANNGRRGVLPIWQADPTIKSAEVMYAKLRDRIIRTPNQHTSAVIPGSMDCTTA